MTQPEWKFVTVLWISGEKNPVLTVDVWECSVVFISSLATKKIITINKILAILASTQWIRYTYFSTWISATFGVCPQSFLLASDSKSFFIPTSSPFSLIQKAPRMALSNPCSIYFLLSWYDGRVPNAYLSPMMAHEATRKMGKKWTNERSGFRVAYS